ncbi:hypothetical protein EDB81DRAFT_903710 [Dactylonectria macrodidyma]|uniref:Uncharacterized protein n=1 Tax=Dactylonectria macrodidyma TaxID=307937 RepID=A0A9P9EA22_9HYPO|nr:hypothetical protein EDB81DRAFT_903710 [Dactylonectria macrodidyma]
MCEQFYIYQCRHVKKERVECDQNRSRKKGFFGSVRDVFVRPKACNHIKEVLKLNRACDACRQMPFENWPLRVKKFLVGTPASLNANDEALEMGTPAPIGNDPKGHDENQDRPTESPASSIYSPDEHRDEIVPPPRSTSFIYSDNLPAPNVADEDSYHPTFEFSKYLDNIPEKTNDLSAVTTSEPVQAEISSIVNTLRDCRGDAPLLSTTRNLGETSMEPRETTRHHFRKDPKCQENAPTVSRPGMGESSTGNIRYPLIFTTSDHLVPYDPRIDYSTPRSHHEASSLSILGFSEQEKSEREPEVAPENSETIHHPTSLGHGNSEDARVPKSYPDTEGDKAWWKDFPGPANSQRQANSPSNVDEQESEEGVVKSNTDDPKGKKVCWEVYPEPEPADTRSLTSTDNAYVKPSIFDDPKIFPSNRPDYDEIEAYHQQQASIKRSEMNMSAQGNGIENSEHQVPNKESGDEMNVPELSRSEHESIELSETNMSANGKCIDNLDEVGFADTSLMREPLLRGMLGGTFVNGVYHSAENTTGAINKVPAEYLEGPEVHHISQAILEDRRTGNDSNSTRNRFTKTLSTFSLSVPNLQSVSQAGKKLWGGLNSSRVFNNRDSDVSFVCARALAEEREAEELAER